MQAPAIAILLGAVCLLMSVSAHRAGAQVGPGINSDPASLKDLAGVTGIDGTGVTVGQFEADNPDINHNALKPRVSLSNSPPPPAGPFTSAHATEVAGAILGVAPKSRVVSYATRSKAGSSVVKYATGGDLLVAAGASIVNASAAFPQTTFTPNGSSEVTLAVDYFAFAKNIIWVQAAGNSGNSKPSDRIGNQTIEVPGDCFDCITVGATRKSGDTYTVTGFSSEGRTTDLRNKPDIVAPGFQISLPSTAPNNFATVSGTSFAAPQVSGVAALLLQFAKKTDPGNINRLDHRVIKAVLLNSASKDGGEKPGEVHVTRKDGTNWLPTTPGRDPLDDQMGAGQVNAAAAIVQFNRPEATRMSPAPGTSINFNVDPIAWDFNHVYVGNFDQYNIDRKLKAGTKLTATLIWDRHVTRGAGDTFAGSMLSNLDLDLYENGALLHTFDAQGRASFSDSTVDSVEHIYFTLPTSDFYSVRVSDVAGQDELFGFAVWSHPVPEPATILLLLPALGLLAWRFGRRSSHSCD